MKNAIAIIFTVFLLIHDLGTLSMAYDDTKIHPAINENAATLSRLNSLLKLYYFSKGLDAFILNENGEGKTIKDWITTGGTDEDNPFLELRYTNHFHDPLKEWDQAGLDIPKVPLALSSVVWAQVPSAMASTPNLFSWQGARQYYRQALLTGSQEDFAKTFLTLGHLMHLVADLAVPAHVRNDSHPGGFKSWQKDPYEIWTADKKNFSKLHFTGLPVDPSIFNNAVGIALAPLPISALWDQDRYTLANPDPAVTKDVVPHLAAIGLAEYTNANFLSNDTIFKDYPHPAEEDLVTGINWAAPETVHAEDGKTDKRAYLWEDAGGTAPMRLAAAGYLTRDCMAVGHPDLVPVLDENVHEDYAAKLIPRAVGYSAALLDYFFRGTLEISPPAQYVYSIIDASETQHFTQIKAKVRNSTSGEAIGGGSLVAIAKYRNILNLAADLSDYPPSENEATSLTAEKDLRSNHSVTIELSQEQIAGLNSAEGHEFVFDFPLESIYANIVDLSLQVVFSGTLGNEPDAVAVGVKDLNEPQHLVIWNNTDYFLLNGVPRKAEEIPNPDLYGYVYPTIFSEYFGFAATETDAGTPMTVSITDLPPARYSRIILLTDAADSYWIKDEFRCAMTNENWTATYTSPRTVNQTNDDGSWREVAPGYNVRGIRQHDGTYFVRDYPYFEYTPYAFPAPPENALGPWPVTIDFP